MKRELLFGTALSICALALNAQNEWKEMTPGYLKPVSALTESELTSWRVPANLTNNTDNTTGAFSLTGGQIGSHYNNMVSSFSVIENGFQIAGFQSTAPNKAKADITGWIAYIISAPIDAVGVGKTFRFSFDYDMTYFAPSPSSVGDILTIDTHYNGTVMAASLISVNQGLIVPTVSGTQNVKGSYRYSNTRATTLPLRIRLNMPNSGVVNRSELKVTNISMEIINPIETADIISFKTELATAKSVVAMIDPETYLPGSETVTKHTELSNYLVALEDKKDANNVSLFADYSNATLSPTFLFEQNEIKKITDELNTKSQTLTTSMQTTKEQSNGFKAFTEGRMIFVSGTKNFEIFNSIGTKMTTSENLEPGLYLIKTASKTIKVIIK